MKLVERLKGQMIDGDAIDWQAYMKPSDCARVIPVASVVQEVVDDILLGREAENGLTLPWGKAQGKVLIRPGKLCIWTGWSHHGKTAMLKQLMLHAINNDERILIASLEEELREIIHDLAIIFCGTQNPSVRYLKTFVKFVTDKLWLYDQHGTVEAKRMQAVLRYAASEYKITQSMIDSLMMLAVDRDDYNAQSTFVGELKSIAKDTHQTVHLVAHMRKRDGGRGDEMPGHVHDIAGGHEIASKADYVFNVWRDKKPEDNKPACILGVEKQRGRVNWIGKIGLEYLEHARQFTDGKTPMRFVDITRHDESIEI